ncbi:insulinase family protein [Marinobacter sp. BSs20148]|uniref:insulinase family protein n=1 Tax=Marinobacter sp. BSs20148 TaxID=490759 RepID=UPI00027769BF|nr:insulinase family protein [Marinobacter sp. BSs20148]AFP30314.1 ecreted/periplasmic Zn-dependent peptidase, insulinase-like protein [Marinobacter sp. BSs20148]
MMPALTRPTRRNRFWPAALTFLCLLVASSFSLAAQELTKSPNDANLYRYLQLDNGLRVLLVSDKSADKAAASLNVAVGSGDDPADREGLSHFLEHMLFLGTEKYPEPGEYQQFIASHGGSHNAFTAFQDTNYFFDVQAEFLEPALDRFAQQFSAPLFTAELVDRERNAVHSEYSSKLKEDGRRFFSVRKAVTPAEHAFHQFAVGNLTTLENSEQRPLREDLVEFWQQHYSANLMNLAVYGPQSLDRLEQLVRGRFDAIEDRKLTQKRHSAPLVDREQLPTKVTVASLKDIRNMSLVFPIASQQDQYRTKPARYVTNLLGHEGPGSLFDVLKRAGLAESLSAGLGMDTGDGATLEISMALTKQGLEQQDTIFPLVFAYIDKVRDNGISEQRFEEMRKLADIDFRFNEKSDPVHQVMRLAGQLQHYPAADILRAPWLLESYAPGQYREILEQLTPDNLLLFVLQPEPDLGEARATQWYNTQWQQEPLSAQQLNQPANAALASQLALPKANPFIPENLAMLSGNTMNQPEQLLSAGANDGLNNGGEIELWYARDTRFGTPKANVYLSLRTPLAQESARNAVLLRLLTDALNTNLNAWAYSARLAGLDFSIYPHLRGLTLRVGGYSDQTSTLLRQILQQVANPELTQQRFDIARQNLVDSLVNQSRNRPSEQIADYIQTALLEGAWQNEDKLKAAQEVTLNDLQAFQQQLMTGLDPVMLVHGNLSAASALNMAQQARALIMADSQYTNVERSRIRQIPAGETRVNMNISHPDTGYALYLQGPNTSLAERAQYRLLTQIIRSPFYENIRTQRQLGYIVYATSFEMLETPALALIVQSPDTRPQAINAAVDEFMESFASTLAGLGSKELEQEKQAVISGILEQERQLGDISGRFWSEIDRGNSNFDSREQLAAAIENVSLAQLQSTFRTALEQRERALLVTSNGQSAGVDSEADKTAPASRGNADEQMQKLRAQPPVAAR